MPQNRPYQGENVNSFMRRQQQTNQFNQLEENDFRKAYPDMPRGVYTDQQAQNLQQMSPMQSGINPIILALQNLMGNMGGAVRGGIGQAGQVGKQLPQMGRRIGQAIPEDQMKMALLRALEKLRGGR